MAPAPNRPARRGGRPPVDDGRVDPGQRAGGDPPGAAAIDGSSWDADAYPDYCATAKYGPWTPPPRRAGDETLGNPPENGIAHTYAVAGAYRVRFWFRSDSTACGLHEPYGSYGAQSVEVVVLPAETTTTSTPTPS